MRLNKKGISYDILNMALFRLMFITIIFFVLYLFLTSLIKTNIDISNVKNLVLINRVLYSGSIAYNDEHIGRAYPGVVDTARFNDDILTKAFNYSEDRVAMRLELTNLENNEVKEVYLNKKWYDRLGPLTKFEQYGKEIKWRYVLIKDKDKLYGGLLRIDMVMVNE